MIDPETTRPSLGRLAVVNENEQIQIEEASPVATEVSPSSIRTRRGSAASSRFFPGGWFHSTTKLPEDGRTSLDRKNANTGSDASPTLEAPLNTPIDGHVDDKKKQKWCVIM